MEKNSKNSKGMLSKKVGQKPAIALIILVYLLMTYGLIHASIAVHNEFWGRVLLIIGVFPMLFAQDLSISLFEDNKDKGED